MTLLLVVVGALIGAGVTGGLAFGGVIPGLMPQSQVAGSVDELRDAIAELHGDMTEEFEKNSYFYGQLLTATDFEEEQDYHRSQMRGLQDVIDGIEAKLDGKPDIKILTQTSVPLGLLSGDFNIDVSCTANFKVLAVYADISDPDLDIEVEYRFVDAFGELAGQGIGRQGWQIQSDVFFLPVDWFPYELLSHLHVEPPVGVPREAIFRIDGVVVSSSDPANDTVSTTAVLETAQSATCSMEITES